MNTINSEIKWTAFKAALESNLDGMVNTFRGEKSGVDIDNAMQFIDKIFVHSLGNTLEYHIKNNVLPDSKIAIKTMVETLMSIIHSMEANLEDLSPLLSKDEAKQFGQAAVWMPVMIGVALDMCIVNHRHQHVLDLSIDKVVESESEDASAELDGLLGSLGIGKE